MTTTTEPPTAGPDETTIPTVSFDTDPASYKHWKFDVQGDVPTCASTSTRPAGSCPATS